MSMYVRIKRDTKTWFLHTDAEDEVRHLIEELATIEERHVSDIRLISEQGVVLEGTDTVKASQLSNNSLVYLVFQKEDNTWEDVCVRKVQYKTERENPPLPLPAPLVQFMDQMNASEHI